MSSQDWVFVSETTDREAASGRKSLSREYRVWGYDPATVREQPEVVLNSSGESLPAVGSVIGAMILERYDVSTREDRTLSAIARFSNHGRFAGQPTPIAERVGYSDLAGDLQETLLTLPVAIKTAYVFTTDPAAGVSTVEEGWELSNQTVRVGGERLVWRVTLQTVTEPEHEALRAQHLRLHLLSFGGAPRYYLFRAASYSQTSEGPWEIQYEWVREDGLRSLEETGQNFAASGGLIFPMPRITDDQIRGRVPEWAETGSWIIPPFHALEASINTDFTLDQQVRYSAFLPHVVDNFGWQTLPGVL